MPPESTSKPKYALSKRLKVGVLCGGSSSERKISLRSGRAVCKALRTIGFDTKCMNPASQKRFRKDLNTIDVAFIALHGEGGEDGEIQALLKKKKIPYVGSDPKSCRRSFQKDVAKRLFRRHRIPTPEWVVLDKKNWKKKSKLFKSVSFVKPCNEGSSLGIFGVKQLETASGRIRRAIQRYGKVLAEERIEGREFTVGILKGKALPVIELVTRRPFYDYRAKYTKGMTQYKVPAPIRGPLKKKLQRLGLKTHKALGLRDMSRVDMMVSENGKPYVLEANTIPGFTELSLLPKAAKAVGIDFSNLCYQLVEAAYRRK